MKVDATRARLCGRIPETTAACIEPTKKMNVACCSLPRFPSHFKLSLGFGLVSSQGTGLFCGIALFKLIDFPLLGQVIFSSVG